MIRAVLDTNVVVSALLSPEGPAALVLSLAISKKFRCYVSERLFAEYNEVLARPEFGLNQRRVVRLVRSLCKAAVLVAPTKMLQTASDPDDNKFLECALKGRADYVITRNFRDFPAQFRDIRVIFPEQFLVLLTAQPN
jgi:uncharacterized protein